MTLPSPARSAPEDEPARVVCAEVETAQLRALVTPMHTAVALLFEVVGGWRRGADERWVASMLRRAEGIDLTAFAMFGAEERIVPDTLTPTPARSGVSFRSELEAVAALPPEATRDELIRTLAGMRPSPGMAAWIDDPVGVRARYLEALEQWWEAVIEPEWPRMLALLESEVLRVGRVLATEGQGAVLSSIHPRVRWQDGELHVPSHPAIRCDLELDRRTVVLLPLACGPNGLLTFPDRPGAVVIAYAAPGTGSLFCSDGLPAADPLAEMLGAGKAAVLRALDYPRPMRALGQDSGLAVSTVCEHLQSLARAGLVQRTRAGRHVIHSRSARGERLVALF